MNKTLVGILCGLGAASIWGGMYVVSKVVLEIIPPFSLVSLRLLLGALTLAIVLLMRGFPRSLGNNSGRCWCWLCGLWHLAESAISGNKIIHRGERFTGHFCNSRVCAHLCMDTAEGKDYIPEIDCTSPGNIGRGRGDRPAFGTT